MCPDSIRICSTHSNGVGSLGLQLGHYFFIDKAGINHDGHIQTLGICNSSAIGHFGFDTQFVPNFSSFFTPSMDQYFVSVQLREKGQYMG